MGRYIIVLGVCLVASHPVAAQNPSVTELLDKYAATQDKLQSFILKCETSEKTDYQMIGRTLDKRRISEVRYDGNRYFVERRLWGRWYLGPNKKFVPRDKAPCQRFLWDGKRSMSYMGGAIPDAEYGRVIINRTRKGHEYMITGGLYGGGPVVRGFLPGDAAERIDSVLHRANKAFVRAGMEEIGESNCYVIDAKTERGDYTVWIDPSRGHNILKAEVRRYENHLYRGISLRKGNRVSLSLKDVRLKKVQGVWVPVEGYTESTWLSNKGTILYEKHHVITEITLNPDHDALRSFEPDFIKNGALVAVADIKGIRYRWQDGKVVDSYGHEVNLETLKPPSLMGKALPNLTQFNLRLNPKLVENKMVLVCFWDMNQRPSRNCVQNLNKRAQTLLNRNVYMIFVHAGPVAEQKLIAWLKNNKIKPPAGMSRANLPELGQSWGVQSLPWLILTDKKHIVQAEGFSINELDEKITTLKEK